MSSLLLELFSGFVCSNKECLFIFLFQVQIRYSASDTFHFKHCDALSAMVPSIKKVQYRSYLGNRQRSSIKKLAKVFDMDDHPGEKTSVFKSDSSVRSKCHADS